MIGLKTSNVRGFIVSINDFLKSCVVRKDGSLLCWDYDDKQYIIVDIKKSVVSITDITEDEIISLKKKADADKNQG